MYVWVIASLTWLWYCSSKPSIDAPEGRRGTSEWPLPYGNLAATVPSSSGTHWQVNSFLPDLIILGWACSF